MFTSQPKKGVRGREKTPDPFFRFGAIVFTALASLPVHAVEFCYDPLLDAGCTKLDPGNPSAPDPTVYGVFDISATPRRLTYYIRVVPPSGDLTIDDATVYSGVTGYPTCSTASATIVETLCNGSCPNPLYGSYSLTAQELNDMVGQTHSVFISTTHQAVSGEVWVDLLKDPPGHCRASAHAECTEDPPNPDPEVAGYFKLDYATGNVEFDIGFNPSGAPGGFTGKVYVDVDYVSCDAGGEVADLCGTGGTPACDSPMHGTYNLATVADKDAMLAGRHTVVLDDGTATIWIDVVPADQFPDVPTTSEWGMIVMVLLLCLGATLVFSGKRLRRIARN